MCGIAGWVDPAGCCEPDLLARMCQVLEHRGPNERGTHIEPHAALGIQRLAIIDVKGGQQPVFNEAGDISVVFNGEIYNHAELRRELEARGHRFSSHADTEVLVHLYEDHGEALVDRLRGMFAFAIWDRPRRRLLLGRDRVGKKPLYWTEVRGRLVFASEVRALLQDPGVGRDVDMRAIDAYLLLQYVPDPLSAFAGIHKLQPASTLLYELGNEPKVRRYWRLDRTPRHVGASRAERAEELARHLDVATRIRLMSEVPLGAFLSGGVDSTAVVGAMARNMSSPVRTFAIGFRDRVFDESGYARQVAEYFSTDHTELVIEPDALSIMPKLARHYGEPFADPAAIPSFYLAEMTSRHVTVALNGDGGDESFAGYGRHRRAVRIDHLDWLPSKLQRAASRLPMPAASRAESSGSILGRAYRLAQQLGREEWERYLSSLTSFDERARSRLRSPAFVDALGGWRGEQLFEQAWNTSDAPTLTDRMLDVDVTTYLSGDLLPKVDIASMAYSLEARSPFLDQELMAFAASLPTTDKLAGAESKVLLKQSLRGNVPDEVLERPKMGFGVPLGRWFREELRDLPADVLLDPRSLKREWFERAEIERLIGAHHAGVADHSLRLWVLIQLELWWREVVEVPIGKSAVVQVAAPRGVADGKD